MKTFNTTIFILLTFCMMAGLSSLTKAQDTHFSQFYASPLTLNPAATGVFNGDYRFSTNYKSQWGSISNAYKTTFASFDMPVWKNQTGNGTLGAGISFYSDKGGASNLGLTQVNLSVSYNLRLDENNTVSAGLQSGFAQRSLTLSELKWDNQFGAAGYDPTLGSGEMNLSSGKTNYMDFLGGLLWNFIGSEQFKASGGVAMAHFNKPDQSLLKIKSDNLDYKFTIHGGAEYNIKDSRISILPQFMFVKQGAANEFIIGSLVKYRLGSEAKYGDGGGYYAIYLGGYVRARDAAILNMRLDYKQNISLGISYDFTTSNLSTATYGKGGLELSLIYKGFFNGSTHTHKYISL
jgi:type IX secretion system PorP/SprF family membrane protein